MKTAIDYITENTGNVRKPSLWSADFKAKSDTFEGSVELLPMLIGTHEYRNNLRQRIDSSFCADREENWRFARSWVLELIDRHGGQEFLRVFRECGHDQEVEKLVLGFLGSKPKNLAGTLVQEAFGGKSAVPCYLLQVTDTFINQKLPYGRTNLELMMKKGKLDLVAEMLRQGALIINDYFGESALTIAARRKNPKSYLVLRDNYAHDFTAFLQSNQIAKAFRDAVLFDNFAVISLLIADGADQYCLWRKMLKTALYPDDPSNRVTTAKKSREKCLPNVVKLIACGGSISLEKASAMMDSIHEQREMRIREDEEKAEADMILAESSWDFDPTEGAEEEVDLDDSGDEDESWSFEGQEFSDFDSYVAAKEKKFRNESFLARKSEILDLLRTQQRGEKEKPH